MTKAVAIALSLAGAALLTSGLLWTGLLRAMDDYEWPGEAVDE